MKFYYLPQYNTIPDGFVSVGFTDIFNRLYMTL